MASTRALHAINNEHNILASEGYFGICTFGMQSSASVTCAIRTAALRQKAGPTIRFLGRQPLAALKDYNERAAR